MNMMSLLASIVLLLFVFTFVPSRAIESRDEVYWKSKLGNITMPKVLMASIQSGSNDEIVKLSSRLRVQQLGDPFDYLYYHETPLPQDERVTFFTNDKLSMVGTKLKLHFNQISDGSKFLPLDITKSISIASNNLQEILNILSLSSKSIEAKYIANMIKECESKGTEGEVRHCALSLQDMVDYATSSSSSKNTKLMLASTEVENNTLMEYAIHKSKKLNNDDNNNLVCHKLNNPFVVFLCHKIRSTDVFSVSLVGANGKQMKAVAVCHKDTSKWYPGHSSFKILNLKPGEKPICHFASGDTIVWIQN